MSNIANLINGGNKASQGTTFSKATHDTRPSLSSIPSVPGSSLPLPITLATPNINTIGSNFNKKSLSCFNTLSAASSIISSHSRLQASQYNREPQLERKKSYIATDSNHLNKTYYQPPTNKLPYSGEGDQFYQNPRSYPPIENQRQQYRSPSYSHQPYQSVETIQYRDQPNNNQHQPRYQEERIQPAVAFRDGIPSYPNQVAYTSPPTQPVGSLPTSQQFYVRDHYYTEQPDLKRNQYEREQYEREQYEREKFEREKFERERYEREAYERERINREQYEREQYERHQYEREQYERQQYEREQYEREQHFLKQKFPGQQPQREQDLLQRQIPPQGYVPYDQRRESMQPGLVVHQEPTAAVQPGFPKQFANLPPTPFQQHPPSPAGIPLDYQKSPAQVQYGYQAHQSSSTQSQQLRHTVTQIAEPLELRQQHHPAQHQKHYHHEGFPPGNAQIPPRDVNDVKRLPPDYFQRGHSYEQNPLSTPNHVQTTVIPVSGVAGAAQRPQYYYSHSEPIKHQQPFQPRNLIEGNQPQSIIQKQPYYIYLDKNNAPSSRALEENITKGSDKPYEVKTFQVNLPSPNKPHEATDKAPNPERKNSALDNDTVKSATSKESKSDTGNKKSPKTVKISVNVANDTDNNNVTVSLPAKVKVSTKTKELNNNSLNDSLVSSKVLVTDSQIKTETKEPELKEVLNKNKDDETEDKNMLNTEVKDHNNSNILTDTEKSKESSDSKRIFLKRTFIEVTDPTKKRSRKSSKRVHVEKNSEFDNNNNPVQPIKTTKRGEIRASTNRKSKKVDTNASNLGRDDKSVDHSKDKVSHNFIKSESDTAENIEKTAKIDLLADIAEKVDLKDATSSEKEAAQIMCQLLTNKKSQNTVTAEIKRLEKEVLSGLNDIEKNLALSKNDIYLKRKGDLLKKYYSLCDDDGDYDDAMTHEVKEFQEKDFKDIDIRGVKPFNDLFSPIESDMRERTEFEKSGLANLQKVRDNANVKLYFDESLHIYSKICTEVGTRLLKLKNFLLHQQCHFETVQKSNSNQIMDVQSSKSEKLWKSFLGELINNVNDEENTSEKQNSITNLIFQNFNEFSPIISEEEFLILTDPNSPLYDQFVIKQREDSKTGEGKYLEDDISENSISRTSRRRSRAAKKVSKQRKEVISSEDEIDELIKFFKVDLFNVIEKSENVDRKSNYFNQLFNHWDSNSDISSTINKHSNIDSTKSDSQNPNVTAEFEQLNNTRKSFNMSSGVETYNSRTGISTASNNSQTVKNPYLKLFLSAIYLKETGKNSVPKALRGLGNEKSSKDGINAEPSGKRTTSRLRAARMEAVEKGASLSNGKSNKKEIYTSALIDYDDMDKIVLKFQSPLSLNNNEISEDIKMMEETSKIATQGKLI
ncbi:hypothetical protein B5S29_g2860 [[Candida] boidinii]|nr:hypothetical protein B5S29_g2860 [[Candida] boidinii]